MFRVNGEHLNNRVTLSPECGGLGPAIHDVPESSYRDPERYGGLKSVAKVGSYGLLISLAIFGGNAAVSTVKQAMADYREEEEKKFEIPWDI